MFYRYIGFARTDFHLSMIDALFLRSAFTAPQKRNTHHNSGPYFSTR